MCFVEIYLILRCGLLKFDGLSWQNKQNCPFTEAARFPLARLGWRQSAPRCSPREEHDDSHSYFLELTREIIVTCLSALSIAGVLVGATLLFKAWANIANCKSVAPLYPGSWATLCVSCVFYLMSRSGCFPSPSIWEQLFLSSAGWRASVMPRSPSAIHLHLCTFWNWQHPHLSSDPSINSWVPARSVCSSDSCIFLHAEIAATEWLSEWVLR